MKRILMAVRQDVYNPKSKNVNKLSKRNQTLKNAYHMIVMKFNVNKCEKSE